MATTDTPGDASFTGRRAYDLNRGTLLAAAAGVCVAQVALAIPAVLNGLFQQDLGTTSSQLTWISDAFLVPVTLLELTFGVLGDLFGRKRLLVIGSLLLMTGQIMGVLTPGAGSSTGLRVVVLWSGQIVAGLGAAAIFPTTLAMVAAGTHTARDRARGISIWAAALSSGGFISPVLGGWLARLRLGRATSSPVGAGPSCSWPSLPWSARSITIIWARDSAAPEGRSLDWPGQVTIAVVPVRAAVRRHPGADERLGQRAGDRRIRPRAGVPGPVHPGGATVERAVAAAGPVRQPGVRHRVGRHRPRHVRVSSVRRTRPASVSRRSRASRH